MKYIYTSIFCFLAVLILCTYSSIRIIDYVGETEQLLEEAVDAEKQGDKEESLHIIQKAGKSWKNRELFFGTVLRHDEIDGVMEEFARLESYASTEDQDDFLSNCKALIARLQHIQEMEKPSFQNIM